MSLPKTIEYEHLFSHKKRPSDNHGLTDLDALYDQTDGHLQALHRNQRLLRSFINALHWR